MTLFLPYRKGMRKEGKKGWSLRQGMDVIHAVNSFLEM